jgi:hypothetical protein
MSAARFPRVWPVAYSRKPDTPQSRSSRQGGLPHLCKLLARQFPVRLGPLDLARVALHLEVLVALGAAELEHLWHGGGQGDFRRFPTQHSVPLLLLLLLLLSLLLQQQLAASFPWDEALGWLAVGPTVASFLTKVMPWPGYTVLEQNQHFSSLTASQKELFSRVLAACMTTASACKDGMRHSLLTAGPHKSLRQLPD